MAVPYPFDWSLLPPLFAALALALLLLVAVTLPPSHGSQLCAAQVPLLLLLLQLLLCNSPLWSSNSFGALLQLFVAVFLFILFLYLRSHLLLFPFEFSLLLLFSALGLLLLLEASDFLVLYLALELASLPLYAVAALRRSSLLSTEAGLKYFILGAFSSSLFLFGLTLLYGSTGTLEFASLVLLLGHLDFSHLPLSLFTGLFFLLVAFFFKVGLAPLHLWIPDVYDGSPIPALAYFATATKGVFALVLLRLLYQIFHSLFPPFQPLLLLAAFLSVLVGTLGALHQHRLKRLIGYSGIVHGGYVGLALSTGTQAGLVAALAYLAIYLFLSLNLFLLLYPSGYRKGREELRTLADLSALLRSDPPASVYLTLNLFSLAGLPPLAGFFAKLYVLLALVDSGYMLISVLVLLLSVASAVYYLRLLKIIYFERPHKWSFHSPPSFFVGLLSSFTSFLNFAALLLQPLLFALLHLVLHV